MKLVKRLAQTLITAAVLIVILPMTNVQAKQSITKENFDYKWYLEQHPDLAATVSADDYDTIWAFYETVGEPAGWNGRCSKESFMRKNFNYYTFMDLNPDVKEVFGFDFFYSDSWDRVYDWYMSMGILENRPGAFSEETTAVMEIYDIADSITNLGMSEREKVKAVHDWMCINIAYDYDNYLNGTVPHSSYSIEGAIKYGKSVCNGYALTFEAFMDILGIECEVIHGKATNSVGHTGGHAWNKVKVDGIWYWIDVTWDDPVPDRPGIVYRYDYFLISEEQMNRNHTPS